MKSMTVTRVTGAIDDVVASARPAISGTGATAADYTVRVTAPFAAQVAGEKSAVGTDDITLGRSGHVPWSPPV